MCWARNDLVFQARGWSGRDTGHSPEAASELRVSDADRQRVVERLRSHTAEGRLTLDEFEERVEEAFHARTGGDLQTVMRDLPPSPAGATRIVPGWLLNPLVVIGAVIFAVSLAVGNVVIWPLFVALGICAFGGCGSRQDVVGRERAVHTTIGRSGDALTPSVSRYVPTSRTNV